MHIIATACQTGPCTNTWQYATESWTRGGVILGLFILAIVLAAVVGAVRKAAS